ncbi:MAG: ATPase/DNA packaging protein [bacterium]
MARQRMYLFERGYVDYKARLKRFFQTLRQSSLNVWKWFWIGKGASISEITLKLLIIVTAISLSVMYVQYEKAHDRSFSFSAFFVMCIIFTSATILLWGWKPPVHFATRLLSAVTASGTILLFSIATFSIALLIFPVYFIVLFLLTAASFMLFLPIRGLHILWLWWRKLTYECPYDDCHYNGMPIHVCTCGEQYHDLYPSFYGIFHHLCRHNGQYYKLPTLEFWGRNKLTRLCGGCKRPLIFSELGELPVYKIAIVGGTSSGKTIYLIQLLNRLLHYFKQIPNGKASIANRLQNDDFRNLMSRLNNGQFPSKTAGDVMTAFGLAIQIPKMIRSLLYLFDAPGEDYGKIETFWKKQGHQHLNGIILVVDPFSLPALKNYVNDDRKKFVHPSGDRLEKIVDNLINAVNMLILKRPSEKCTIPLAVVISKTDAFDAQLVEEFPFLGNLISNNNNWTDDLNLNSRETLISLGAKSIVQNLEQKFTNINYFACSALGRIPQINRTDPFLPSGVEYPLLWMLTQLEKKFQMSTSLTMAMANN